jgi:Glycosyl transferase family 2
MCTYNGAAYLPAQLQSLAAQTRLPDELIVCDDGSADASTEIVHAFAAQAAFPVRLYSNEQNIGSTKNFEQAIELCQGEIIALADQDDVWNPDKLARLENVFTAEPAVGLVFSDAELVDAALRPLGRRLSKVVGSDRAWRKLQKREQALRLLLPGWLVAGATMAFRTEFRSLALPIPADIAMIHDGWLALMIAAVARVCFIAEPLMCYRQHAAQQIGARVKEEQPVSMLGAARRFVYYGDMLKIVKTASARLQLKGGDEAAPALRELEIIGTHLQMRGQLPAGRLRRLPLVLRELLNLHYHRYGKGMLSAAKDILS